MVDNLELWNSVCKTDPAHTKPAKMGGMTITAIAPQYQIMNATAKFGPYGVAWGFKSIELDYSLVDPYKLIVFKGQFFCPDGACEIINSAKLFMDRNEKMIDADFAKKIETDSLTKALSKMGFNADVFMGCYDDVKYVEQMRVEHAPAVEHVVDEIAQSWIVACRENSERLKEIECPTYRAFIAGELLK